jgi:hypothetical protein
MKAARLGGKNEKLNDFGNSENPGKPESDRFDRQQFTARSKIVLEAEAIYEISQSYSVFATRFTVGVADRGSRPIAK